MKVGCILLAAGFARRFGENKLLAEIDGISLIERAFQAVPPHLFYRAVVVSQYPDILRMAAAVGYTPVANSLAAEGIAASIRLGLAAVGPVDGALFAVCDQPRLTGESVRRLVAAFDGESITALGWQGVRGNPVIFPQDLFPPLLALTGDRGGSAVLKQHPQRIRQVEAQEKWELWDVDRPKDL